MYMYNYTSSGLKDCFMCEYLRNLAMGRMLEPVYIRMKKNTPVEKMRGSCGLSCEEERGKVLTPSLAHEWCGDRGWWSPHMYELTSIITLRRLTTLSTSLGSKVSSNWIMCGSVVGSERSLFARGSGRTMAPSLSLMGGGGREEADSREG